MQNAQNNGHSIYSPSKAHRYMRCPGSIALEEGQPDSSSSYAQEGTAAHELAEMVLTEKIKNASEMLGELITWEEGGEVVTWKVDHDMVDFVTRYCEKIYARIEEFEMLPGVVSVTLHVEEKIDLSSVIGVVDQSGTADIVIVVEFEDGTVLLSVEDLKYGRGVEVVAEDNEQAMTYAAGVVADYELAGYDVRRVIVAIHQIRKGHFSEHEYTIEEIRAHVLSLRTQVKIAEVQRDNFKNGTLAQDLVLSPGEKQCRFCKAKAFCPAARNEVAKTVYRGKTPVTPSEFDDLEDEPLEASLANDVDWLAACLGKVDFIEEWCRAIRAAVHARLLDGEEVPGFKLVKGKLGNRQWTDKVEAEEALKAMRLKQTDMYSMSIISPTQAEKLLKDSPRRWNKLQDLITRKDGAPAVAPESDKRPALEVRAVADDFDDESGEDLV